MYPSACEMKMKQKYKLTRVAMLYVCICTTIDFFRSRSWTQCVYLTQEPLKQATFLAVEME